MDLISGTLSPKDPQYQFKRRKQVDEFLHMTPQQINRNFLHMASQPVSKEQRAEQQELTRHVIGDILATGIGDQLVRKSILDSTGGGTSGGSVLIRQDLEAPVYAYVKLRP